MSKSKGYQTMKFVLVIEPNMRILFIKNHPENEASKLVPDLFSFFKKALYEVNASGLLLSFNILP